MHTERKIKNFINAFENARLHVTSAYDSSFEEQIVNGVTYNSKEVGPGYLFVVKGAHFKEQYLYDALDSGAVCFVREDDGNTDKHDPKGIYVSDIRKAMPIIAETYYGRLFRPAASDRYNRHQRKIHYFIFHEIYTG